MNSSTCEHVVYTVSQDLVKYSSRLPSNQGRSLLVHSLANSFGVLSSSYGSLRRVEVVKPKEATNDELGAYHAQTYLDVILHEASTDHEPTDDMLDQFGLADDCPRFVGLPKYARLVAGATLTAADALRFGHANISINWDGGRHHAQKSSASGFCYVADCILAILLLKRSQPALSTTLLFPVDPSSTKQRKPRVMYLDLDLHFSDAVSQAFYSPGVSDIPGHVLTLSIHHAAPGFFPISPLAQLPFADPSTAFDPYTLSLPLLEGASNRTFAAIWPIAERVKDIFDPDYVIVQCGVDGLAGDSKYKVFNWGLSLEHEGSLGWCVSRIVNNWNGRKLFLGGGGYNGPNAARAWTYLTSIILGKPIPVSTNIPDHPSHSGFPLYAPSFTLDVPAGNMQDTNTVEYLAEVTRQFNKACEALQQRSSASTDSIGYREMKSLFSKALRFQLHSPL
ncbi:Arginase/deacetylase [Rhodocollybia butyracea]|uniref:Histone deacetylase 8 n=1 Tax=Rhodocollybia butyracea TaxID=206335 RepID=A0A9P5UAG8_9AGAR|nr:Arginase/deacetylase [Rhodocollybia butyracea]